MGELLIGEDQNYAVELTSALLSATATAEIGVAGTCSGNFD